LTLLLAPLARPTVEGRFCVRGVKGTQAEEHLDLERADAIQIVERLLRAAYRVTTTGKGGTTLVARAQAKLDREKTPRPPLRDTHPWYKRGLAASPGRDAALANTHDDHGAPEGAPRSLAEIPKAQRKPLRPPTASPARAASQEGEG
jgi:hypothetical protein